MTLIEQLVPVFLALSPFIVPILAALLTLIVKACFEKMPSSQRAILSKIVGTAVSAVEQSSDPLATPVEKKAKAIAAVTAQLEHFGIKAPLSVVDPMIEESVLLVNMAKDNVAQPVLVAQRPMPGNA